MIDRKEIYRRSKYRWTVDREKMDGYTEDRSVSGHWTIDGLKIDRPMDRK